MITDDMVERVARLIAGQLGDDFDDAFKNKGQWTDERGFSGNRFRDVNEPFQSDYLDAARAAIEAMHPVLEDEPVAPIWRNGITNTVGIIDEVRRRFVGRRWTGKTYAEFDDALDEALDRWFRATRVVSPTTYEEAEQVFKDHIAGGKHDRDR